MTSRITVEAICPDDKEVRVVVLEDGIVDTEEFLQNGEVEVYLIHDNRELFTREQTKS
jgi:sulfur relay (sulfurtransferase) complex TusBCD TusD component (DsrE family)